MLRRPPTSIDLKLDDIREYESMRAQMAKEERQSKSFSDTSNWQMGPKSKEEVYARVGYVPDKPGPAPPPTRPL